MEYNINKQNDVSNVVARTYSICIYYHGACCQNKLNEEASRVLLASITLTGSFPHEALSPNRVI